MNYYNYGKPIIDHESINKSLQRYGINIDNMSFKEKIKTFRKLNERHVKYTARRIFSEKRCYDKID